MICWPQATPSFVGDGVLFITGRHHLEFGYLVFWFTCFKLARTLIGAILGVGVANALMEGQSFTTGVNWNKAMDVGASLLFSPMAGFIFGLCDAGHTAQTHAHRQDSPNPLLAQWRAWQKTPSVLDALLIDFVGHGREFCPRF